MENSQFDNIFITKRLKNKLNQIYNHPITTVIAPMGFGKTTAIKWWSTRRTKTNDSAMFFKQMVLTDSVAEFWTNFCKVFKNIPEVQDRLLALGFPNSVQALAVCSEILYTALEDYGKELFFILDDVHILPSKAVTQFILFFAKDIPSNAHIILMSRNQIFNEAERLELGHKLHELSFHDLSLDKEELYEYARLSGLDASEKELDELAVSSEGWFAIIYLNFKAYEKDKKWLSGSTDIFSLINEVLLEPLSEAEKEFLILMGIGDEFTEEQAAYLWEVSDLEGDSDKLLSSLSKNNAFIAKTEEFYVYHHMLRQSARHLFSQKPEEYKQKVHTRMGDWHMEQKEYTQAYLAYVDAGDFDKFLTCMEVDMADSLYAEYAQVFFEWLDDCPEEILLRHPSALGAGMLAMFTFNNIDGFYRFKELLLKALEINEELTEEEKNNLLGDAAVSEAVTAFNDIPKMGEFLEKACTLLSRTTYSINFNDMWTFGSPSVLMLYHSSAGSADTEYEELKEAMSFYQQVTDGHGSGAVQCFGAELHFERGEFAKADILNKIAMAAAKRKNQFSIILASEFLNMRLELVNGNFDKIKEIIESMENLLREKRQYALLNTLDVCRMYVAASLGRMQDAPEWMEEDDIYDLSMLFMALPMLHTFYNQMLLAKGEYTAVIARSEECHMLYGIFNNILCTLWLHVQLAGAYEKIGMMKDAKAELKTALDLAMPDNILMPFAENKNYILKSLLELKKTDGYSEYINKILELSAAVQSAKDKINLEHFGVDSGLGLSERELEIARLAANRMTTAEIAEKLYISEGTVRNHLSRVFEKLGITGTGKNKRFELEKFFSEQ